MRITTAFTVIVVLGWVGCGGGSGGGQGTAETTVRGSVSNAGATLRAQGLAAGVEAPGLVPRPLYVIAITDDGRCAETDVADDGSFSFKVPTGDLFTLYLAVDTNEDGRFEENEFMGIADGYSGDDDLDFIGTAPGTIDLGGLGLPRNPMASAITCTGSIANLDTDDDGVPDYRDDDADDDGMADREQLGRLFSDDDLLPNAIDDDDDDDGIHDDDDDDDNGNGIDDRYESDRDGDGIPDHDDEDDDNDGFADSDDRGRDDDDDDDGADDDDGDGDDDDDRVDESDVSGFDDAFDDDDGDAPDDDSASATPSGPSTTGN